MNHVVSSAKISNHCARQVLKTGWEVDGDNDDSG